MLWYGTEMESLCIAFNCDIIYYRCGIYLVRQPPIWRHAFRNQLILNGIWIRINYKYPRICVAKQRLQNLDVEQMFSYKNSIMRQYFIFHYFCIGFHSTCIAYLIHMQMLFSIEKHIWLVIFDMLSLCYYFVHLWRRSIKPQIHVRRTYMSADQAWWFRFTPSICPIQVWSMNSMSKFYIKTISFVYIFDFSVLYAHYD